jgi:5'-deoxynucleotidase YfbR-like HD superfamily hydrolase
MGQVNSLLPLADLAMRLGAVNRATLYPDGVTAESDTDHTVMLALMACAAASAHPELRLDIGLVCQFAVVHDLPEAWAGDTDSFFTAATGHAPGKAEREAAAIKRIEKDCTDWPWLADMIRRYERQKEPEARFVRYMDKVCPPLTNTLNGGAAIRARGVGKAGTQDAAHAARLAALYPEFALIVGAYLRDACNASEAAFTEDPPAHPHDAAGMDWSAR